MPYDVAAWLAGLTAEERYKYEERIGILKDSHGCNISGAPTAAQHQIAVEQIETERFMHEN